MLNKELNYIVFDFETTGLDVKKDEAIQIGIVKFNYKYEIIKQFSSYIKPENLQSLSEIVEFTTGIKKEQLETAPSFKQIENEVLSFFDNNSVLIGHNIAFDIGFLEKYVGKLTYKYIFDTYVYARKFLHFEPAYALEILADKYGFKGQSHDALADSIMSMQLFKIIIKKIEKIIKKYSFLADIILKSDNLLGKILILEKTNKNIFSIPKKLLQIPKVKKISLNEKNIGEFKNKTVFNVKNSSIEQAINFCLNGQNKIIFSFSSNARMNVAKSILKSKYLSFSTLNNGFTISKENEEKLLAKNKLQDFEVDFIIKSFTHYDENISIFDIANFDEYKVYNFLADKKRNISSNIVLSTHIELFNYIKNYGIENIKDYKIMFFDFDKGLSSLSTVINKGFDFYELSRKIELLIYKSSFDKNEQKYEQLLNDLSTFFGILFTKIQPVFKNTNNKIELVNLLDDTRTGINQLKESFFALENKIKQLPDKDIIKYWSIFSECIQHYCIIEQKLFQNGNLKYIFYPLMENVDINSFNDIFENLTYYNFTTLENKNYIALPIEKTVEKKINFIDWKDNIDFQLLVKKIKEKLESNKSLYLVSNNKNFSNSLFKLIFNLIKEYNLKVNLYAENITGGQGKLLYYLQKDHETKLTIGGPEFLIQNKAKHVNYDEIHFLSIGGKNRTITINDLYFYLN